MKKVKHYLAVVSVALLSVSTVATANHQNGEHRHKGYSANYFGKVETIAGDVGISRYKLVTLERPVIDSGWVVTNDSTKLWVDADCRAQLEAGGLTTQIKPWEEISVYPNGDYKPCDEIKSDVGDGTAMTRATVEGYVFYDRNRNSNGLR